MAKYVYIIEIAETVAGKTEWWEVAEQAWTHETATRWAHETFPTRADSGGQMRIRRTTNVRAVEQGNPKAAKWVTHRVYVVDAAGIVRRTDRPTTAPSERKAPEETYCEERSYGHGGGEDFARGT